MIFFNMKKIILAAAALVAGLAANAVGFDYTTTSMYTVDINTIFTNLNNVTISQSSAPTTGNVTGKNSLNNTAAGDCSFEMGGVVWSWSNSSDGATIAKQYGNYVQPNGTRRTITIPTTAGDVVTIVCSDATSAVLDVTGADVTSLTMPDAGGTNTYTLTATGSSITLYNGTGKPKFSAITVGGSSAVAEAAAAEKAQVAQVGLVKIFNDGSKEIAK